MIPALPCIHFYWEAHVLFEVASAAQPLPLSLFIGSFVRHRKMQEENQRLVYELSSIRTVTPRLEDLDAASASGRIVSPYIDYYHSFALCCCVSSCSSLSRFIVTPLYFYSLSQLYSTLSLPLQPLAAVMLSISTTNCLYFRSDIATRRTEFAASGADFASQGRTQGCWQF